MRKSEIILHELYGYLYFGKSHRQQQVLSIEPVAALIGTSYHGSGRNCVLIASEIGGHCEN